MKSKSPPRVGLQLPTNLFYGREVLHGLFEYVRGHRPWRYITGSMEELVAHLKNGDAGLSAVVGMISSGKMLDKLEKHGVPTVNISERQMGVGTARVLPDNVAAGRMAAKYFLDKKFVHFAFSGYEDFAFSKLREEGFRRTLKEAGHECAVLHFGSGKWPMHSLDPLPEIGDWLKSLPKPAALFAHADDHARRILNECARLKISVPDEVAVLGCDNDEIECELSPTPISSVSFPLRRLGYEAAEMVEHLIGGGEIPSDPVRLAPSGIITRRSTDIIAVKDPVVARALSFICGHASESIDVGDVVKACGASRRYLERRFNTLLGRTPKQEIHRMRIGNAKRLLAETHLPMTDVAAAAGFTDAKMLSSIFRRDTGQTPSQYRRAARQENKLPEKRRSGRG